MTDTGDVGLIEKPENKASRYGTWLECFHRRRSGLTDFREQITALYGRSSCDLSVLLCPWAVNRATFGMHRLACARGICRELIQEKCR